MAWDPEPQLIFQAPVAFYLIILFMEAVKSGQHYPAEDILVYYAHVPDLPEPARCSLWGMKPLDNRLLIQCFSVWKHPKRLSGSYANLAKMWTRRRFSTLQVCFLTTRALKWGRILVLIQQILYSVHIEMTEKKGNRFPETIKCLYGTIH